MAVMSWWLYMILLVFIPNDTAYLLMFTLSRFFHPRFETTVERAVGFLDRVFKGEKVAPRFKLTDHGVANDSTVVQTAAIQRVIDKAETMGGGEIIVPPGTFLSGALFFKPGTTLRPEEGAVIKGSDNIEDYPLIPSRMEGRSIYYHAALINAYHVDGFEINGPGTINGNGYKFGCSSGIMLNGPVRKTAAGPTFEVRRPRLVFLWGATTPGLAVCV